jgi:hypothetical protein
MIRGATPAKAGDGLENLHRVRHVSLQSNRNSAPRLVHRRGSTVVLPRPAAMLSRPLCCQSPKPPRLRRPNSKTGGGATGTIRPSTSPRLPTSDFQVRGTHGAERPRASIKGCPESEGRG